MSAVSRSWAGLFCLFIALTLAVAVSSPLAACEMRTSCGFLMMDASISSQGHQMPAALQGQTHLSLSGDHQRDLQQIEAIMATENDLRLSLAPQDWAIFELAIKRSGRSYRVLDQLSAVGAAVTPSGVALMDVSLSPRRLGA